MLTKYYPKAHNTVKAMPINLPNVEVNYEKWGGAQQANQGDWLVNRGDEFYTVEQSSFNDTYRCIEGNTYLKIAPVWAEIAKENGKIKTKEGESHFSAGDYLVYNDQNKKDGYAIKNTLFNDLYSEEKPTIKTTAKTLGVQMQADDYIRERVDDQIQWFEKKASWNQKKFKNLQILTIVFGAMIPLLTVIDSQVYDDQIRFIIALLGCVITIISAVINLYKFQENWVKYRSTAEALIREKYRFYAKAEPYDVDEDSDFKMLVERCQAILSEESNRWEQSFSAKPGAVGKVQSSSK